MNNSLKYQAYYTKSDPILSYMTNMLNLGENETVLEPCGGDGAFVDKVLEQKNSVRVSVFELNSESALFLHNKYRSYNNVYVKETDTLLDNQILSHTKKYDKIIGNPPYGARNDLKKKEILSRLYSDFYTKESYTLFLYVCTQCLREGGILSFIIPDTFLSLHRHLAIRKFLLTKTKIKEITLFPSSFFPGINFGYANLCIITLEKSSDIEQNLQNNICIRTNFNNVKELEVRDIGQTKFISQKSVYENIGSAFFFNSTDKILELINDDSVLKIGDIASCVTGFYSGNDKKYLHPIDYSVKNAKNYQIVNKDNIRYSSLSDEEKLYGIDIAQCFIPIVKGGNVEYLKPNQWFMNWSKQAISEYKSSKKCRFQNSSFYFKNGIAIPMIRSSKLTAALINRRLFDQSIVGVFPKDESLILYLLGFFNSDICTTLISTINPSTNNSANYIKKIPFIEPTLEFLHKVDALVEKILVYLANGENNIQEFKEQLNLLFSDLYLKNIGRKLQSKGKTAMNKQLNLFT
ncbi:Eco57I restriction-modification methylase domain-containing protein [Capnocytophaga granulosa]|jgi:hypothetical protein